MAPNQEQPVFDHSKVDFTKVGPRHVHMEKVFRHLGLWNPDQVKVIREKSEEDACITLRNKGYLKVGQLYFEYVVDYGVWYSIRKFNNISSLFTLSLLTTYQSAMPTYHATTILGLFP
jgi:hypothetical protein